MFACLLMSKTGLMFIIEKNENNRSIHLLENNRLNYGVVCYGMLFSFLKLIKAPFTKLETAMTYS